MICASACAIYLHYSPGIESEWLEVVMQMQGRKYEKWAKQGQGVRDVQERSEKYLLIEEPIQKELATQ